MDTSGIKTRLFRTIQMLLKVRQETQVSLSSWHSYIGIPIHFQEESGTVTLWIIEFRVLSQGQRDVRLPVQIRWTPTAFSRVSSGYSDMPSSCEMKHEPEFKSLQGNLAFFWVRVSRDPFHLRQKTQGPSQIPVAEGKLLLRCLWKVGSPLQSKTGNQLSSWGDLVCTELSLCCCTEIDIHIDLRLVSQGISAVS